MIADNELLPWGVEVINGAIMSGQPVIVVEGVTDINTYRRMASRTGRDVHVRAVELIRGYGEGCSEVVRLIEDLESSDVASDAISGNLVGIIDKDVRDHRNEIPGSNNVIVLKFYSIESHFVFADSIVPCLKMAIPGLSDESLPILRDRLFSRFVESIPMLRIASLEALKGAVDSSYSADFTYSDSFGRLKDTNLIARLQSKHDELISFSNQRGIEDSLESMKAIIKGKVLLDALTSSILMDLKNLHNCCGVTPVPQCGFCAGGVAAKCELRIAPAVNDRVLRNIILNEFPASELSYLIDTINEKIPEVQ